MARPARLPHFSIPHGGIARTDADKSFDTSFTVAFPTAPKWLNESVLRDLGPGKPSLISTLHGAMSRVLMTMPDYIFKSGGGDYLRAYDRVLSVLPKKTALDVVVNEKNVDRATKLLKANRPADSWRLYRFGDEVAFTVWAQDAYAVVKDLAGTSESYFIEPFFFRRRADSVIADFVSHASDLENSSAPLYFQGGNILVGDDFFLIGADYPQNTLAHGLLNFPNGATIEERKRIVSETYRKYLDEARELHIPGSVKQAPKEGLTVSIVDDALVVEAVNRGTGTQQPIFHIDMFISLMGRNDGGKYVIAVGDTRMAGETLKTSWGELALSELFDEVAAGLAAKGFEIIRTPLPLAFYDYLDNGNPFAADDLIALVEDLYGEDAAGSIRKELSRGGLTKGYVREWYFATSNNVLSAIDGTDKHVWIPEYGFGAFPELKATDDANRAIWERQGFTVTGLGDFHVFAHALGAAHCITKYLARI